ncbi:MAG: hypothetical protein CMM07_30265 [Rhodopirellula sp.]|nr:hypothetical protein [Rhodopirellula sp.]
MKISACLDSRSPQEPAAGQQRSGYFKRLQLSNQPPENRCLMGRAKRAGITQTTEGNDCMVLADQNWN